MASHSVSFTVSLTCGDKLHAGRWSLITNFVSLFYILLLSIFAMFLDECNINHLDHKKLSNSVNLHSKSLCCLSTQHLCYKYRQTTLLSNNWIVSTFLVITMFSYYPIALNLSGIRSWACDSMHIVWTLTILGLLCDKMTWTLAVIIMILWSWYDVNHKNLKYYVLKSCYMMWLCMPCLSHFSMFA